MLLRGFLFCNICKQRYWGGLHKNQQYSYYFCKSCGGGTYVSSDTAEKQVEKLFKKLAITDSYAQEVVNTAKEIVREFQSTTKNDRLALQNNKRAIERKKQEAEDNLLDKTLSKDAFKAIYERLERDLISVEEKLASLNSDHTQSINDIEKLMQMSMNIGKTYKKADIELKRHYIGLFFQEFMIEDKKIVKSIPSESLKPFLGSEVRVRQPWLPNIYKYRNYFIRHYTEVPSPYLILHPDCQHNFLST